jgi:hypothetical protein
VPLTRASDRAITVAIWLPVSLVVAGIALLFIAFGVSLNDTTDSAPFIVFFLGVLVFLSGVIGRLVIRPFIGPQAKVREIQPGQSDRLVELRRLHPLFTAAVSAQHAA